MKKFTFLLLATLVIFALCSVSFATTTITRTNVVETPALVRPSSSSTPTRPATSTGSSPVRKITINEIKMTINEPKYGEKFDWNPVMVTEGITFDHMYWEGYNLTDAGGYVGLNENDIATNTKYQATIYFTVNSGYALSSDLKTGTVNETDGLDLLSLSFSPHGIKTPAFEVTKPVTRPDIEKGTIVTRPSISTEKNNVATAYNIEIADVKVGEALPKTAKLTNDVSDAEVTFDIPMSNLLMKTSWTPNDEVVKAGTEYTLAIEMNLTSASISDDLRVLVNRVEIPSTIKNKVLTATYKVTIPALEGPKKSEFPTEKNWINKFEVTVTEPETGKKPSDKATAVTDGFTVSKVVWTPADSVFKDGVDYSVKIYVKIDEDRDLRSDYFGLINGRDAKMPVEYDKDNFYLEYNFGKVTWEKASAWAEEELNKANDLALIPSIFENNDLTTNITRREFAHVAVKLYEKVSGQKAIAVASNPFADTDDGEVLKAYNVGITNGTSDTTFNPDDLITREQMATMMTRALAKAGINTSVDLNKVEKFADDAQMDDWGRAPIYYMSSVEIIKGVGNNTFDVLGKATKEQALLISERSAVKFSK